MLSETSQSQKGEYCVTPLLRGPCVYVLACSVAQSCPIVACQAPLSMGFPSKNTRVDCHFLLQGILLTQGSYPGLLHWQVDFTTEPPGKESIS